MLKGLKGDFLPPFWWRGGALLRSLAKEERVSCFWAFHGWLRQGPSYSFEMPVVARSIHNGLHYFNLKWS
jgi:hypothetical protein